MPMWRNWQTRYVQGVVLFRGCRFNSDRGHRMYVVYILQSLIKNWFYVGLSNNHFRRLIQHNTGQVKSTKAYKPYKMVFKKSFRTRSEARDFEKFLKIRSNKEKLLRSLKLI